MKRSDMNVVSSAQISYCTYLFRETKTYLPSRTIVWVYDIHHLSLFRSTMMLSRHF